jgi:hypothetical protein
MKISVNVPSYKRPKVETLEYLPFARIWIDSSEATAYKKINPKAEIVECRRGVQGNISRVRNHIIREEFKRGMDAVAIIDDDMRGVFYWEGMEKHLVERTQFMRFLEKFTLMAEDLGAKLWGVNVSFDKQFYREYTPFSMVSYIGSPFTVILKGNACWYDESLPLKEDYDMTLQQLNRYRKVLRINKYFYLVRQSSQEGGCSLYRNHKTEMEQLKALQRKWGSNIVRIDRNDRNHQMVRSRVRTDYNPVIRAPIAGI